MLVCKSLLKNSTISDYTPLSGVTQIKDKITQIKTHWNFSKYLCNHFLICVIRAGEDFFNSLVRHEKFKALP